MMTVTVRIAQWLTGLAGTVIFVFTVTVLTATPVQAADGIGMTGLFNPHADLSTAHIHDLR